MAIVVVYNEVDEVLNDEVVRRGSTQIVIGHVALSDVGSRVAEDRQCSLLTFMLFMCYIVTDTLQLLLANITLSFTIANSIIA